MSVVHLVSEGRGADRIGSLPLCRCRSSVSAHLMAPACLCACPVLSCVFVSSPAGQSYPIANYDATPAGSPPSYSLITPGDSSGGVQLSFTNGVVSGSPVQVVMQFKCTVRYEINKISCWGAHWR